MDTCFGRRNVRRQQYLLRRFGQVFAYGWGSAARPFPVWVETTTWNLPNGDTRPYPCLDGFFEGERSAELIITKGLLDAPLRFPLGVWFATDAPMRQSPVNTAVAALVRNVDCEARMPWYGTAVVLKYSGSRRWSYIDMTEYDLGGLASYYMSQQDV